RLDRLRGPRIPRLDVEIRATDAGLPDPDQDVVDPDLGLRDRLEPEAGAGLGLHQREHLAASLARAAGLTRGLVAHVGPVHDGILHPSEPLDLAADAIARLEEDRRIAEDAHARRRPGRDEIARLERDRL